MNTVSASTKTATTAGSVLAIVLRTALLLLALVLVARKAWLGELLRTPFAQLTLGDLLWAFLSVCIGLNIGTWLVVWMINIPSKEKRSRAWAERWIGTAVGLAIAVAFPFIYEGGSRRNEIFDAISAAMLTTIGWLVS